MISDRQRVGPLRGKQIDCYTQGLKLLEIFTFLFIPSWIWALTFTALTLSNKKGARFISGRQKQSFSLSPTQALEKPATEEREPQYVLYVLYYNCYFQLLKNRYSICGAVHKTLLRRQIWSAMSFDNKPVLCWNLLLTFPPPAYRLWRHNCMVWIPPVPSQTI